MKSMLADGTQLFTFLLNKTKSYSRQFLEVKGLDQDRGVWCTTILSSIFPLSDLLFNYSSTHLKSILKGAHRWTGFLWRRPLQISRYVKLLFINFSHNFLKLSQVIESILKSFLTHKKITLLTSVVQNCKQNIMPLLVVFLIEESRQRDWCKLKC